MRSEAKKDTIRGAAALIILAISLIGFVATLEKVKDDSALPDPGPRVLPAPEGLGHLLNVNTTDQGNLERSREQRLLEFNTELDRRLYKSFQQNLKNIAARKGWHAATLNDERMQVTLPAAEIGQLKPLLEDPVDWINANHQPGAAARAPDLSQEMVTAELQLEPNKKVQGAWALGLLGAAMATALSLVATVLWGGCAAWAALTGALRRKSQPGSSRG